MKKGMLVLGFVLSVIPVKAILPPAFKGETVAVKDFTNPKELVVKYFNAVDDGFSVRVGDSKASIFRVSYNEQNLPARYEEFNTEGKLKECYERTYSENGLVKAERKMGGNRLLVMESEYVYENPKESKSLKEQRVYDAEKKLLFVNSYMRNKNKDVSAVRRTDGNGRQTYSYEYYYDEDNNLIREVVVNPQMRRQSETEYGYDEHGRKISEIVYNGEGKMVRHSDYTYNGQGLVSSLVSSVPGGEMQRYDLEYEYDEKGNWIKQTIIKENLVPSTIVIRKITY